MKIDSRDQVDKYAIHLLIRSYSRPGINGVPSHTWKAMARSQSGIGHPATLLVKEARKISQKWQIIRRIEEATLLPFSISEAPTSPIEKIVQCISILWYLSKNYPQHFKTPQVYNNYLSVTIDWRLNSVEAIFRDCFDHFPLSPEKISELHVKAFSRKTYNRFKLPSRCSWHFPLEDISSPTIPFLPNQLPRPDKFTFVRAMEFAHIRRIPRFAREVWARREAWRAQIDREAEKDLKNIRWTETNDDDILRYESYLVDEQDREWVHHSLKFSEQSEGAANILYEGYIRLLYIEILTFGQFFDEAFTMILEGTGERYPWTQGMLTKVKNFAKAHDQRKLCAYIDNLDESGLEMETESPDAWWEHSA